MCSRCGTQAETFETSCPNCGRSYGLGRGAVIGIIAASVGASVLLLGGCGALIAVGINGVEDRVDEASISRQEYHSIPGGMPRDQVERRLGDPWAVRDQVSIGGDDLECIYYNEEGSSYFDDEREFGFCFIDDKLVSKTTPEYDPPGD